MLQIEKRRINEVINPLETNKMYRRSRFLVGLAAAAITFSCLWFSMGLEYFNHGHKFCERGHGCMMEEHHRHCCEEAKEIRADKVIIVKEVVKTDSIK
jgi:hypothetical protein